MRRVVVTGLGAVTPLGLGASTHDCNATGSFHLLMNCIGVERSWKRLVDGHCAVVSLTGNNENRAYALQQCQVAGLVPRGKREAAGWTASEWLSSDVRNIPRKLPVQDRIDLLAQEERRMSTFMQYAMVASHEALQDANWHPKSNLEREMTVSP